MTVEGDQLARVAELALRYGVRWHHCRDSRHCVGHPGLQDLILVGRHGLLFRELKTRMGTEGPAQVAWRLMLRAAGADVGLWLPSHFRDGTVEREIAAIA